MEDFTWLLVSRMFIPLVEQVQPHKWEVFEWSPELWKRMGSSVPTPPIQTRQFNQDIDTVGVFEL